MDRSENRQARAFTLIEMLLVVVIIGVLAGAVAIGLSGRSQEARYTRATADIAGTLSLAIDLFEQDVGRYPTSDEGLAVLAENNDGIAGWRGPYVKGGLKPDPWGKSYQYSYDATHNRYTLASAGPDGQAGNEDDITETR